MRSLASAATRLLPAFSRPAHHSAHRCLPWLGRAAFREHSNVFRMIVDQPVGVSGTRAYAVGRVGGRGKWKGSALSIQPRSSFNVLRVDLDGLQISLVVPVPELLKSSGLHARDLIALGVQDSYDSESWNKKTVMDSAPFVPHPVILARKGVILIAMGNIKAMIFMRHVLVFEAKQESVKEWATELEDLLKTFPVEENPETSFELVLLESILNECCDLFDRRVNLYRRIVQRLGFAENQDMTSGNLLLRLLPLKDSLQQFEAVVKETRSTLIHLLENEDDMLAMLLNEKEAAKVAGKVMDRKLHDSVELLVENYLRQMSKTLNEVHYLQWRVQTKQDLAEISLDVFRNRMLRVDVQLAMASVAVSEPFIPDANLGLKPTNPETPMREQVGSSAVIAGIFGMNIPIGLEESHGAFFPIIGVTFGVGMVLYYSLWAWTSGYMLRKYQEEQMAEQEALHRVFADMGALDLVVRKAFRRHTHDPSPLNLSSFDEMMRDCVKTRSIQPSAQEVKLMFDLLDATQDGSLHKHEVFALEAAARRASLSQSDLIASDKIDHEKR